MPQEGNGRRKYLKACPCKKRRKSVQLPLRNTGNIYRKATALLERRFQPVMVEEPSVEETIEIIKGIRDYYEKNTTV